jgi:hypothetical protein
MVTKKDFFQYMSYLYEENYKDTDTYSTLKKILKVKDPDQLKELSDIITMNGKQRLAYRHALAANGKELTPLQVDKYISMIEYALSNMDI